MVLPLFSCLFMCRCVNFLANAYKLHIGGRSRVKHTKIKQYCELDVYTVQKNMFQNENNTIDVADCGFSNTSNEKGNLKLLC